MTHVDFLFVICKKKDFFLILYYFHSRPRWRFSFIFNAQYSRNFLCFFCLLYKECVVCRTICVSYRKIPANFLVLLFCWVLCVNLNFFDFCLFLTQINYSTHYLLLSKPVIYTVFYLLLLFCTVCTSNVRDSHFSYTIFLLFFCNTQI